MCPIGSAGEMFLNNSYIYLADFVVCMGAFGSCLINSVKKCATNQVRRLKNLHREVLSNHPVILLPKKLILHLLLFILRFLPVVGHHIEYCWILGHLLQYIDPIYSFLLHSNLANAPLP